jgi:ferredoxin-NADP reductase
MRALFETIDAEPGRLTLLYRASWPADVVFADELRQIARRRGARIEWMIGPSGDPGNRMTAANLHRLVPGVADHDVYLCAGPALAAAVRAAVTDAGLPRRRLHEESFVF